MFRFLASPAWRAGAARALALVLCAILVLASEACVTTRFTDDPALVPAPFRAGLVVRVFETDEDAKAGRLSTREITSVVEGDDGVVYEARGAEWSIDDADPGAYRLAVTYGAMPGSPNGAVFDRKITLVEGRTLAVDVKTHWPSWALVGILAAAMAAMAVVVVAGCVRNPAGCSSRRPVESLPSGESASHVPRAPGAARPAP